MQIRGSWTTKAEPAGLEHTGVVRSEGEVPGEGGAAFMNVQSGSEEGPGFDGVTVEFLCYAVNS